MLAGRSELIEALLNIRIPELWVTPITENYNISLSCQIGGHSRKTGWGLVTIKGDDRILDKILEEIKNHQSVGGVQVKTREQGLISFLVDVIRCKACEMLIKSKAFMVFPVEIQKGRMKWLLITDDNRIIGKIFDDLAEEGYDIQIERVTTFGGKRILTDRQEETIRAAFSSGYFEYPKRTGSSKLASSLGISVSTLSEIMRAAQRRILAEYLRS
jgi:predicted DNA binding protein